LEENYQTAKFGLVKDGGEENRGGELRNKVEVD
jgi:hypothetical protein